jgi:hypothetical protein
MAPAGPPSAAQGVEAGVDQESRDLGVAWSHQHVPSLQAEVLLTKNLDSEKVTEVVS